MKTRISLTIALLSAFAVGSFALSPEYEQWGNGPAQYLMTKEETARWKTLTTNEEANAFVNLFWARRDPTPATPRNEFREEFEARVDYADKNLASGKRVRGSMTDRGKVLVLFGAPTRIERSGDAQRPTGYGNDMTTPSPSVQWVYEDDMAEILGTPRGTVRFTDRVGTGDFKLDRGLVDVGAAQQRAIAKAITQPDLSAPPSFAVAAPAASPVPAPPAAAPAPAVQTELTTEALKTAVAELKSAAKNPYDKQVFAKWDEFVTPAGTYYVPVSLYVPKAAGLTASQELTFFGVVQDESGKNVLAFEQPAKLVATKDDFYIDTTLTSLPSGKHRGFFGLAENGKPLAMVASDMTLAGSLDKDAAAISDLLLSNDVYPLTEAQDATDPFAFGGVKVIPKGDKTFRSSDEMWYFFELRNPGLVEAAPPADGTTVATVAEPAPKIQVKIDIEGAGKDGKKVKISAPPAEVPAIAMKGVPGHFGVGSAIPLSSFKPGDYSFTMKVIDTVKKTSHSLSDKFKVIE